MGPEPVWIPYGPGAGQDRDWESMAAVPCPRTTMRLFEGGAVHRDAHLRRLGQAMDFLGAHHDWLRDAFDAALIGHHEGLLRVRVMVRQETLLGRLEPLPPMPSGYRLLPLPHPLGDARWEPKARHKGLMGAWSEAALALARSRGADDVLCLWPDGTVAETAIASVAVQDGTHLWVPPKEGRVASIAEAEELPDWAAARLLTLRPGPIPLAETSGRSLLCFNAARGVWQAELIQPFRP